jgi:hypothetical protein
MKKKMDDKRAICWKIDDLQLFTRVLQDEENLRMKLQNLNGSLQSVLVVVEQTEFRCDETWTKRENEFARRIAARSKVKNCEKHLAQVQKPSDQQITALAKAAQEAVQVGEECLFTIEGCNKDIINFSNKNWKKMKKMWKLEVEIRAVEASLLQAKTHRIEQTTIFESCLSDLEILNNSLATIQTNLKSGITKVSDTIQLSHQQHIQAQAALLSQMQAQMAAQQKAFQDMIDAREKRDKEREEALKQERENERLAAEEEKKRKEKQETELKKERVKENWRSLTRQMFREAKLAIELAMDKVTSSNIDPIQEKMIQDITEIFEMGRNITLSELNSEFGGQANYKKAKPVWDRGDVFARSVTEKLGVAVQHACLAARESGDPSSPPGLADVIAAYVDPTFFPK